MTDELPYQIKALRADIEALPDRIVSAVSKKIGQELMQVWWTLVLMGLAYGLWEGRWVPVAWGIASVALYFLFKRVFRNWEK